jgi:glucokinase
MSGRRLVGIDLGGTSIKGGAVDEAGEILSRVQLDSLVAEGPEAVCERIAGAAQELELGNSLGIGIPGLVDRRRGLVTASPNLGPIVGFPMRDEVARLLAIDPERVRLENDANVAALGEHWLGGARGEDHALLLTLGTGIGGGLILNGELFLGEDGLAAELGHVTVEPGGLLCGCGSRGCMETLASATAAQRRAREAGLIDDLERLSEKARRQAGPERELLWEVGRDLGRGLAQALLILDVRCFLIGGGFGAALDLLRPGILEGIAERSYGRPSEVLRIVPATLGADAGWIGAARLSR